MILKQVGQCNIFWWGQMFIMIIGEYVLFFLLNIVYVNKNISPLFQNMCIQNKKSCPEYDARGGFPKHSTVRRTYAVCMNAQ